jgi:hypothetical protein
MAGRAPSGLEHNLVPGQVTRLYLLAFKSGVLAIEVVDIKDARHLDQYSDVSDDSPSQCERRSAACSRQER